MQGEGQDGGGAGLSEQGGGDGGGPAAAVGVVDEQHGAGREGNVGSSETASVMAPTRAPEARSSLGAGPCTTNGSRPAACRPGHVRAMDATSRDAHTVKATTATGRPAQWCRQRRSTATRPSTTSSDTCRRAVRGERVAPPGVVGEGQRPPLGAADDAPLSARRGRRATACGARSPRRRPAGRRAPPRPARARARAGAGSSPVHTEHRPHGPGSGSSSACCRNSMRQPRPGGVGPHDVGLGRAHGRTARPTWRWSCT